MRFGGLFDKGRAAPGILGLKSGTGANRRSKVGKLCIESHKSVRLRIGQWSEQNTELWAPLPIDPAHPGDPTDHNLNVLGRL